MCSWSSKHQDMHLRLPLQYLDRHVRTPCTGAKPPCEAHVVGIVQAFTTTHISCFSRSTPPNCSSASEKHLIMIRRLRWNPKTPRGSCSQKKKEKRSISDSRYLSEINISASLSAAKEASATRDTIDHAWQSQQEYHQRQLSPSRPRCVERTTYVRKATHANALVCHYKSFRKKSTRTPRWILSVLLLPVNNTSCSSTAAAGTLPARQILNCFHDSECGVTCVWLHSSRRGLLAEADLLARLPLSGCQPTRTLE